jgi:hypothetical protein
VPHDVEETVISTGLSNPIRDSHWIAAFDEFCQIDDRDSGMVALHRCFIPQAFTASVTTTVKTPFCGNCDGLAKPAYNPTQLHPEKISSARGKTGGS